MDPVITAAVITVLGTGVLSLIGAVVMGKLVPASRVAAAEQAADKWRTAYEAISAAQERQAQLLDRMQMSTEITDRVMASIRARAQGYAPAGDE